MNKPTKLAVVSLCALVLLMVGLGAYAYMRVMMPDFALSDLFQERANAVASSLPLAPPPLAPPQAALPAEDPDPTPLPEPLPEDPPEPTPQIDPALTGKRVNILALGYDMSYERAGSSARTDTMMLISVDAKKGAIDIISFPRDSYVRLEGGSRRNKINAAFSLAGGAEKGGFEAACKTVEWVMGGIPVDFYVGVDMNLFKQLVDAIGGVDYDVDIAFTMNGRRLSQGYQHLSGQQVLDYCRFRKAGRGDIDRVDRQQRMMLAILDQTVSVGSIPRLPEIISSVTSNLMTDLSLAQIGALGWIAKDIPITSINRYTLPGISMTLHDTSYWLILQKEKQEMLNEIFGIEVPLDMSEDAYAITARARKQEEAETEPTTPDPLATLDPGLADPETPDHSSSGDPPPAPNAQEIAPPPGPVQLVPIG